MLKIYSCLAVLTNHQLERFIEPSVKREEEGKSGGGGAYCKQV